MNDNIIQSRCEITRDNKKFVIEIIDDKKTATVTDQDGVVVTISYRSGNFDVRLPNGWGKLGIQYGIGSKLRRRPLCSSEKGN